MQKISSSNYPLTRLVIPVLSMPNVLSDNQQTQPLESAAGRG